MHKHACMYAQGLHLHRLDGDGALGASGVATSDEGRVNMWNLVQLDLFHRLINNKPPAFPFDLNNWRVNLPWLAFDSAPGRDEAVPAMAFLVRSRITLILISFFQALETLNNDGGDDALSTIQPLCMQVEQVFEEWRIVSGPKPVSWSSYYYQPSMSLQ
jgi:hypothetical protein